jgi:hypothetical protein
MNLFNAIYHLYEQQPLIFWPAFVTLVLIVGVIGAYHAIKAGGGNVLADPGPDSDAPVNYVPPSLSTPAAKGFSRHDNIEPVGDELARHVFVNMKRIEDPRPLRVVGTTTRALKVEIR